MDMSERGGMRAKLQAFFAVIRSRFQGERVVRGCDVYKSGCVVSEPVVLGYLRV